VGEIDRGPHRRMPDAAMARRQGRGRRSVGADQSLEIRRTHRSHCQHAAIADQRRRNEAATSSRCVAIGSLCLSVVVPAYNEEARIARGSRLLRSPGLAANLIVVDDGSSDRTPVIVADACASDDGVRLIRTSHAGKGAAVRRGMLASTSAWRFLAAADRSMPIVGMERFLEAAHGGAAIVIGSREATGATRISEPWFRHAIGRVFKWMVKLFVLRGISATRCGFKFSARAVETPFPMQRLEGFGFDVEIVFLAQRVEFQLREIPVKWRFDQTSRMTVRSGTSLCGSAIRWNDVRGLYPLTCPGKPLHRVRD
jgi:glycosyltransferase involved in cell wall biosynthesis